MDRFNHTSWVYIVTRTDRPKSVRNRCVIEVFGGVIVVSLWSLDFSVGVGAFVIELSQSSSLFSLVFDIEIFLQSRRRLYNVTTSDFLKGKKVSIIVHSKRTYKPSTKTGSLVGKTTSAF